LSTLYKKGFLYESVSIQPYSPAAGTGLSSHELNQPGTYKDVKDTSAVAMFKATQASLDNSKWFAGVDQSLLDQQGSFLHGLDHHTMDPPF
jgi:isoleucyl-tRNA synthetase